MEQIKNKHKCVAWRKRVCVCVCLCVCSVYLLLLLMLRMHVILFLDFSFRRERIEERKITTNQTQQEIKKKQQHLLVHIVMCRIFLIRLKRVDRFIRYFLCYFVSCLCAVIAVCGLCWACSNDLYLPHCQLQICFVIFFCASVLFIFLSRLITHTRTFNHSNILFDVCGNGEIFAECRHIP